MSRAAPGVSRLGARRATHTRTPTHGAAHNTQSDVDTLASDGYREEGPRGEREREVVRQRTMAMGKNQVPPRRQHRHRSSASMSTTILLLVAVLSISVGFTTAAYRALLADPLYKGRGPIICISLYCMFRDTYCPYQPRRLLCIPSHLSFTFNSSTGTRNVDWQPDLSACVPNSAHDHKSRTASPSSPKMSIANDVCIKTALVRTVECGLYSQSMAS